MFLNVKPHPKARPRFAAGRIFSSPETVKAERDITILVINHMENNGLKITDKPLCMEVIFYFGLKGKAQEYAMHSTRPDLDNCVKTVCDALNGIVYYDDGQVSRILCEKRYAKTEGVQLKITEI